MTMRHLWERESFGGSAFTGRKRVAQSVAVFKTKGKISAPRFSRPRAEENLCNVRSLAASYSHGSLPGFRRAARAASDALASEVRSGNVFVEREYCLAGRIRIITFRPGAPA
jgi:hypothetical protein